MSICESDIAWNLQSSGYTSPDLLLGLPHSLTSLTLREGRRRDLVTKHTKACRNSCGS